MLDKLSEFNEKWKIAVNIGYVKLAYFAYADLWRFLHMHMEIFALEKRM